MCHVFSQESKKEKICLGVHLGNGLLKKQWYLESARVNLCMMFNPVNKQNLL